MGRYWVSQEGSRWTPWQLILVLAAKPWESPALLHSTTYHERGGRSFWNIRVSIFILRSIDRFLVNCKSLWPVFVTGYLEKQLGLLTLRLNNWGPGTGLDIRHEDLSMTLLAEVTKNKSKDLVQYGGHSCKIGNMRCTGTLKNQNPQFEEKK